MSSRVYLLFPPRGHEPPPTLRGRFNPHLSLQRRRFPIPRYAKRPDVALSAIGLLFLLPTPHCTLKVSKHDSLWQPPAVYSDKCTRPRKPSRSQRCLNALTPGYLKDTVIRSNAMVWSPALCPHDVKRGIRCGVGVVFLAEGSRAASIQEGLNCLGLYHSDLEGEHYFRLVAELK